MNQKNLNDDYFNKEKDWTKTDLLGPFIGHTSNKSVKIWVYSDIHKSITVTIRNSSNQVVDTKKVLLNKPIPAGIATFDNLNSNAKYQYELIDEDGHDLPLLGLQKSDLFFWTLHENPNEEKYRTDFLLLSCHGVWEANDDKKFKGKEFAIWENLPQILQSSTQDENHRVQLAILGGDQVYADKLKDRLLSAKTASERIELYLQIYRKYWSHLSYRKVLCSIPSYLMWDDHDIVDGWGSDPASFKSDALKTPEDPFKTEWKELFSAAKECFSVMQASRNAGQLPESFDFGLQVGRIGFYFADLRTNRRISPDFPKLSRMWTTDQLEQFKKWLKKTRQEVDIVFFVTPVVFAHGSPQVEDGIMKHWKTILDFFTRANKVHKVVHIWLGRIFAWTSYIAIASSVCVFAREWLISLTILTFAFWLCLVKINPVQMNKIVTILRKFKPIRYSIRWILFMVSLLIPRSIVKGFLDKVGDLRDDINDGWEAKINESQADIVLSELFDAQNDDAKETQCHSVILTGDIHTSGYSTIYSRKQEHSKRPTIPQIVSSPVAYPPFPWIGEAFYRNFTSKGVDVGGGGNYFAQIAHHFCKRCAVLCSVRKTNKGDMAEELQLKVKFYLEGAPEPHTVIFDLPKNSHLEKVTW